MSLIDQTTTKKRQIDKKITELEVGNSKEYKLETIWDNAVYAKNTKDQLPGLYYLVAWKKYPKEENIWELSFAI